MREITKRKHGRTVSRALQRRLQSRATARVFRYEYEGCGSCSQPFFEISGKVPKMLEKIKKYDIIEEKLERLHETHSFGIY